MGVWLGRFLNPGCYCAPRGHSPKQFSACYRFQPKRSNKKSLCGFAWPIAGWDFRADSQRMHQIQLGYLINRSGSSAIWSISFRPTAKSQVLISPECRPVICMRGAAENTCHICIYGAKAHTRELSHQHSLWYNANPALRVICIKNTGTRVTTWPRSDHAAAATACLISYTRLMKQWAADVLQIELAEQRSGSSSLASAALGLIAIAWSADWWPHREWLLVKIMQLPLEREGYNILRWSLALCKLRRVCVPAESIH